MKKDKPCLPQHRLLQLANALADRYGFRRIANSELMEMYSATKITLPIIRQNQGGMLWVDRYYVAVQHNDGDVQYVYLTKTHINEERYSYRALKKCRENPATLPEDIVAQFQLASSRIRASGVPFFLSGEVEGLGLPWAEALREKMLQDRSKPE